MIHSGLAFITRKKFSASSFWKDATDYKATVIQYIGELCRYLLNHPPGPYDRKHHIRIAVGNGLRPEIWQAFRDRFNIPEIGEFYGATEGNLSLGNHSVDLESVGAVGRHGNIVRRLTGLKIIELDVETEEIFRDKKTGFCKECPYGIAGELIGPIIDTNPLTRFDGYSDSSATKKKLLLMFLPKEIDISELVIC